MLGFEQSAGAEQPASRVQETGSETVDEGPAAASVPLPAGQPEDEAYECDYERDCTPLYRALENALDAKSFNPIIKFLDTGYWPNSFFADTIIPAVQVKTWVTRFDPHDNSKVKWSQLPLHLAIVCGAPPAVVGRLVKMYPQALRCTDDQHMLPLHLALRHNADDEVVAYLLMHFPDAVNAKGKNGRTAIDCALRAKNKLRGKILELFVEKTRGRKSVKDVRQLKADLQSKSEAVDLMESEISNLTSAFEDMKHLKETTERELLSKIEELERANSEMKSEATTKLERLQSEKLLESLDFQKKLDILAKKNAEKAEAEKRLMQEEEALRLEIETIQNRVFKTNSTGDIKKLKTEIQKLQTYRLEGTRSQVHQRIETLKEELQNTLEENEELLSIGSKEGSELLKSDLMVVQRSIDQLEVEDLANKNEGELTELRGEVETLRTELKARAEASKTRVELSVLKKAMEMELRDAEGKTQEELNALRQAIEATGLSELENKTNAELANVKDELEGLKKELKNRKIYTTTQHELAQLKAALKLNLEQADGQAKTELEQMASEAEEMETTLKSCKSQDNDVIMLKRKVETMHDEVKKREISSKIMTEVSQLKTSIDQELKKSEGMTQQELKQLKSQIKSLNDKEIASKNVDELSKMKAEVSAVREDLKNLEMATQTKIELDELKKSLAKEIKSTGGKTDQALSVMKKAIDAVGMEQKESKTLKRSMTEEIKQANTKTEKELQALKKAVDSIDVKRLESTNKEEWDKIRSEMASMKTELVEKKKTALEEELALIKKKVADINIDGIQQNNASEFSNLRQELDAMRANLMNKNAEEEAMKNDIARLKRGEEELVMKKKGLKKFFKRHFTKKADGSLSRSPSGGLDITVDTIAPPSLEENVKTETEARTSSGEDTDYSNTDYSTGSLLAQLSKSFEAPSVAGSGAGSLSPVNEEKSATVEVETVNSQTSAVSAH